MFNFKLILNKFLSSLISLIILLLIFFFIVGTNFSSFHRTLSSYENSLISKESNNIVEYNKVDYIYSKSNSKKLLNDDSSNLKAIYVFKGIPYILYNNNFFKVSLDKDNEIVYDEKLSSFYVFDVYKDIINILLMFTIGFLTLLFIKIRLKYFKFEDNFKTEYNSNILNKNIYLNLSFIVIFIFIIVKLFSLFVFSIPTAYISILLFVLTYVGNFMLKEYKVRKTILLSQYETYLNSIKIDIEKENKILKKKLIKKYKSYDFTNLIVNEKEVTIDINEFKTYLIDNLIDIDNLSNYEKVKLLIDFNKLK